MHAFLVAGEYWFGVEPSDPVENEIALGAIDDRKQQHNEIKQRRFYVDVSERGDPIAPEETANADAVRAVIGHVHQIGWQLRLGEHIEGKQQLQSSQDVPRHPTRRSRACGALCVASTPKSPSRSLSP